MVSSASVTGSQSGFGSDQEAYFKRISEMNLNNPQVIGFGINNKETFNQATQLRRHHRQCFHPVFDRENGTRKKLLNS
jgi:tryptophan synthase alpha chain